MSDKNEEVIDDNQKKILTEILEEKNKLSIKIKVPENEYNDEQEYRGYSSTGSISSGSNRSKGNILSKYGYSFNIKGFENNSIAYFHEILLGYKNKENCFHVKFDFNELIRIDVSTIDFCQKMLNKNFELIGDIDGIVTDVTNKELLKSINDNKYNIFSSKNFYKDDNVVYDIFCESTFGLIPKLRKKSPTKPNKKIVQLEKLIFLINYIDEINKNILDNSDDQKKSLKKKINNIFHHKLNNKIILCIILDGNYKDLVEQIKNSFLFSKEWNDENDSAIMEGLYNYFKILRNSKIPFLIVYCPRFYERKSKFYFPIIKMYDEDKNEEKIINENNALNEKMKQQDEKIINLQKENELLDKKINNLQKENEDRVKKEKENDEKIKKLEERINTLINNKRKRRRKSNRIKKTKRKKIQE